ncbi:hypothetical protein CHU98_g8308 [Xylaria longipes]|nr:hypothetical protein CHU98_g8308 [Xylaria longipes]
MGDCLDLKSLARLCLASKLYWDTLRCNEGDVAKRIARVLIGRGLFKIAIMAAAARDVDSTNYNAVQIFINTYIGQSEWPLRHYNMRLVARAHCMSSNVSLYIQSEDFLEPSFPLLDPEETTLRPEETQRLVRTFLVCDTASNLFRYSPGSPYPTFTSQPPFPGLSRAFWSQVPEWDVIRIENLHQPMYWWSTNISRMVTTDFSATSPNVNPPSLLSFDNLRRIHRCPVCFRWAANNDRLLQTMFLGSGIATDTESSSHRFEIMFGHVKEMIARSCTGSWLQPAHGMDSTFKLRGFHFTSRATGQHPVPVTSPFYEDDTGLEQLYYKVKRVTGKARAFHKILQLAHICDDADNDVEEGRYLLAFINKDRLPHVSAQTELEGLGGQIHPSGLDELVHTLE